MRPFIASTLLVCACGSTPHHTASPEDILSSVGCLQSLIALISKVHPSNAEILRQKIETGQALDGLERQLILEGIDRLRAAGQCLAK